MATTSLTSHRHSPRPDGDLLYYVNEHQPTEIGESVILVNGMNHGATTALSLTYQISRAVNNSRIVCFHNPILNLKDRSIKAGHQDVNSTIEHLKQLILSEISYCRRSMQEQNESIRRIRVLVLAHSHGAHLIDCAIRTPDVVEHKNHIEIATFGGIGTLPKTMANRVDNFINSQDLAPVLSQVQIDIDESAWFPWLVTTFFRGGQDMVLNALLGRRDFSNRDVVSSLGMRHSIYYQLQQGYSREQAFFLGVASAILDLHKQSGSPADSDDPRWQEFLRKINQVATAEQDYNIHFVVPQDAVGPFEHHSMKAYVPAAVRVINNR